MPPPAPQPPSHFLEISHLSARSLPRTLLRAPAPQLSVRTLPTGPPLFTTEALPASTAPVWRATHTIPTTTCPPTLGFILRDASYPDPPLGACNVPVSCALTDAWYPLLRDDGAAHGELHVRVVWRARCARLPVCRAPPPPPHRLRLHPDPDDDEHENGALRAVAAHPGRLFRAGELRVAVDAAGVPVAARRPYLRVAARDQALRAGETRASRAEWKARRGDAKRAPRRAGTLTREGTLAAKTSGRLTARTSGMVVKKAARSGSWKAGVRGGGGTAADVLAVAKALLNGARLRDMTTSVKGDVICNGEAGTSQNGKVETDLDVGEGARGQHRGGDYVEGKFPDGGEAGMVGEGEESRKLDQTGEEEQERREGEDSGDVQGESAAADEVSESSAVQVPRVTPIRKRRRPVDFGTFRLAVLYDTHPGDITLQMLDKSSHMPPALSVLAERKVELPDLTQFKCCCMERCNSHILTYKLSEPGPSTTKIVFNVTIEYNVWRPLARDTNVTPRFRDVFSSLDNMTNTFKTTYPKAEELTYLLVGGLFTQHYPTYFEKNKQYLQETLRLPRVQTIPIHTEGSIARNVKTIRDSILKTCRGSKSVVLIGHSKGGVDAVSVLQMFPETIRFLHGIISFQAPFGGTFLIDFVSRSKLAVSAISSVIETIWKGDQAALLDLSYCARLESVGIRDEDSLDRREQTEEVSARQTGYDSSLGDRSARSDVVEGTEDVSEILQVFRKVPIIAFGSFASFDVLSIRSAANAAGVASMAPAAQRVLQHTGFMCDGLVTSGDARVPFADCVLLDDMMHTEPALYVKGTRYPPGQLTAAALVLLFEKAARESRS